MKGFLYKWSAALASFFAFVAVFGIKPNSTFMLYEPEIPEELKR